MCMTAIIPLGDENQWGASFKTAPQPPLTALHLPPAPSYERGAFQDGGSTEALMENTKFQGNQLINTIDRKQIPLWTIWPTIWPEDLDYPLLHCFSEVVKYSDSWIALWNTEKKIVRPYVNTARFKAHEQPIN